MIRSLRTRIVTGTVALALMALAAIGATQIAHADGPALAPTTPTPASLGGIVVGPPLAPVDLTVKFANSTCSKGSDGIIRINTQFRVINLTDKSALKSFQTAVTVDGAMMTGTPVTTNVPFYTTQLFQRSMVGTPGPHLLKATTDYNKDITESHEDNNVDYVLVVCPES